MRNVFIYSNSFLKVLSESVKDLPDSKVEPIGSNTIKGALSIFREVQVSDLDGVIMVVSAKIPEEEMNKLYMLFQLFSTLAFETKIVLFCTTAEVLTKVESHLDSYDLPNLEIVLPGPMTLPFIQEKLLGLFYKNTLVLNNPKKEMSDIMSKIHKTSQKASEDINLQTLERLMAEVSRSTIARTLTMEEYLNKSPDSVLATDNQYLEISTILGKCKLDIAEIEDSEVKAELQVKIDILELLKENRSVDLQVKSVSIFIANLKSEISERVSGIDGIKLNTDMEDMDKLRQEKARLEKDFFGYLETSKNSLITIGNTLKITGINEKFTKLVSSTDVPAKYVDLIKTGLAISKSNVSEFSTVKNELKSVLALVGNSYETLRLKFSNYVKVVDTLDIHQQEMFSESMQKKNIVYETKDPFYNKLQVIVGSEPHIGVTLVGVGIAANCKNALVLDMRFTRSQLGYYLSGEKTMELSEFVDNSIEDLEILFSEQRPSFILPGTIEYEITDKREFISKVLQVLHAVHDRYDSILVLVNLKDDVSKLWFIETLSVVCVCDTDIATTLKTQSMLKVISLYPNILSKYLMFTPLAEANEDLKECGIRIGMNVSQYRLRGIPFLAINKYKSKGLNIFKEKPLTKNHFKLNV